MWTRGLNILFTSEFLLLDTHFNMLLSSNRRETAMSRCPTRRLRRCPRRSRCCKAGRGRAGMPWCVSTTHLLVLVRRVRQLAAPPPAPAPFGRALRPLLHLARALRRLRHGLVSLAIRQWLLLGGVAVFAASHNTCAPACWKSHKNNSCCSERHSMPSENRDTVHRGPTIRRLAKGTIDLVRWRAPVQLLKYATRTV